MPATRTTYGLAPAQVHCRLDVALREDECAGFVSARVRDQRARADRREPLGEEVALRVGERTLSFSWGHPWQLGTAAYWAEQTRRRPQVESYALGATLAEELGACMLGGYGIPAAVGIAAYDAVRTAGLLEATPTADAIEAVLRTPLSVPGRARPVRYRFAAQRAHRLAGALAILRAGEPPREPLDLRDWLLSLPGVGPKTASWVVRNHCGCGRVAIVDVHVHRAGLAAGFFARDWRLPRDYRRFETAFCQVAERAGVSAAALDACVWDQLQALGPAGALLLAR